MFHSQNGKMDKTRLVKIVSIIAAATLTKPNETNGSINKAPKLHQKTKNKYAQSEWQMCFFTAKKTWKKANVLVEKTEKTFCGTIALQLKAPRSND